MLVATIIKAVMPTMIHNIKCIILHQADYLEQFKNTYIQSRMRSNQEIYQQIPKKVERWSPADVATWFKINHIQWSQPEDLVDGNCFLKIKPQFLLQQCSIGSMIIVKKIIQWLQMQRQEFDEYVQTIGEANTLEPKASCQQQNASCIAIPQKIAEVIEVSSTNKQNKNKNYQIEEVIVNQKDQMRKEAIRKYSPKKYMVNKGSKKKIQSLAASPKKQQNASEPQLKDNHYGKLAQSSYQVLQTSLQFKVNQKIWGVSQNSTIGRLEKNKIVILDESVSRNHAQILKVANQFYLKDSGSSIGTYVQIDSFRNRPVLEGDVYRFGRYSMEIIKAKVNQNTSSFDLKFRKQDKHDFFNVYSRGMVSVGNKIRDIWFHKEDPNVHYANFVLQNGFIFLQRIVEDCYLKLPAETLWRLQNQNTKIILGCAEAMIRKVNSYSPLAQIEQPSSK